MKCYGCGDRLDGGGWFFLDSPAWRKLFLCDNCHRDSVPSQARREYRVFDTPIRYRGASMARSAFANAKILPN